MRSCCTDCLATSQSVFYTQVNDRSNGTCEAMDAPGTKSNSSTSSNAVPCICAASRTIWMLAAVDRGNTKNKWLINHRNAGGLIFRTSHRRSAQLSGISVGVLDDDVPVGAAACWDGDDDDDDAGGGDDDNDGDAVGGDAPPSEEEEGTGPLDQDGDRVVKFAIGGGGGSKHLAGSGNMVFDVDNDGRAFGHEDMGPGSEGCGCGNDDNDDDVGVVSGSLTLISVYGQPVQMMAMAEMRRSRRSDPHPPKTLDPADSLQSNPSVKTPMGRQRVAAAGRRWPQRRRRPREPCCSDDDDDGIAPFGAFDTAGKALDDEEGILGIDDRDRTFGHDENVGSESDGGGDDDDDVSEDHGYAETGISLTSFEDDGENTPFDATSCGGWSAGADCHWVPECDGGGGADDGDDAVDVDVSWNLVDEDGDDGNAPLDGIDTAGKVVDEETGILQLEGVDSAFGRDEDMGSERDGGGEDGDDLRGSRVDAVSCSSDDEDGGNVPLDATSGVPPIRDVGFL
ncbi:hypothetical protein BJ912DRAFT_1046354 [Pholiota molesta]|nr:hypothetical protein BJ912DRAFT_1046354 [Pholiota molesta]